MLSVWVIKLIAEARFKGDGLLNFKRQLSREPKIISSFHINFKKIRNAHYSALLDRKEMLLQGIEDEYFYQKPLQHNIVHKLFVSCCKEAAQIIIHRFLIVEREEALMQKIKSFYKILKLQRNELQRKLEFTKMIDLFDKELHFYICRKGHNCYNEPWLIRIINPNILDKLIEPILINSLKAKTDVEGVTNLIDWRHINESGQLFQGKYQISKDEFGAKFDKAFQKFETKWRICMLILLDEGKFTAASSSNISAMAGQWVKPIFTLPMALKYKLSFCQNHVLKMIQNHLQSDRRFYEIRSILTKSNGSTLENGNEQRSVERSLAKNAVVSCFRDHWVYPFISSQNYFRFS